MNQQSEIDEMTTQDKLEHIYKLLEKIIEKEILKQTPPSSLQPKDKQCYHRILYDIGYFVLSSADKMGFS